MFSTRPLVVALADDNSNSDTESGDMDGFVFDYEQDDIGGRVQFV